MDSGTCAICDERIEDQALPKFYENPINGCSIVCFECYQAASLPEHKLQAVLIAWDEMDQEEPVAPADTQMRSANSP